ncbi:MAG: dephospho-CoA kinase [Dehalococcoidales bacterium]
MKVIGLTGGIGSGKSTVSQYLAEFGAMVIDADKVGHEALRTTEVKQEIVAAFGREVLTPDGEIDRKKLGAIVFSNPESLSSLNGIMHPRMRAMMVDRIEKCRQEGVAVVIVEAAVLLETEADWTSLVDEIWVTESPEVEVVKRITEQRGLSEEQVLARIHSQLSQEERAKQANVVINNDGNLDEVKAIVKELWERFQG